ncbi:hypothetical protein FRC0190_02016 [Corynebacterium rouxii]|uniref:Uncharacterized protein n=1 Tax=Corynebacterium rouxii TaxID=2719119 RepID=A0A6I8MHJ9_9CORY|nr:hypothetical protein FRC0190_02016 [Corynebacterium rouxii]
MLPKMHGLLKQLAGVGGLLGVQIPKRTVYPPVRCTNSVQLYREQIITARWGMAQGEGGFGDIYNGEARA